MSPGVTKCHQVSQNFTRRHNTAAIAKSIIINFKTYKILIVEFYETANRKTFYNKYRIGWKSEFSFDTHNKWYFPSYKLIWVQAMLQWITALGQIPNYRQGTKDRSVMKNKRLNLKNSESIIWSCALNYRSKFCNWSIIRNLLYNMKWFWLFLTDPPTVQCYAAQIITCHYIYHIAALTRGINKY